MNVTQIIFNTENGIVNLNNIHQLQSYPTTLEEARIRTEKLISLSTMLQNVKKLKA